MGSWFFGHGFRAQGAEDVLTGLLCSFVLAQIIAVIYCRTYRGFAYSRTFVHALVLGAIATTIVIHAIGDSLACGLGVLGALAIIRFRTQIRDPRDIIFLFASLAIGIAAGAAAFLPAVLGTGAFILVALYLHHSPFASMLTHEGFLRFTIHGTDAPAEAEMVLADCCFNFEATSVRDAWQGEGRELGYQVRLRDPSCQQELVQRLNALPEINDAHIVMHRASVEI